eukprot:1134268-Pelagomonas_calceolata.AAC.1
MHTCDVQERMLANSINLSTSSAYLQASRPFLKAWDGSWLNKIEASLIVDTLAAMMTVEKSWRSSSTTISTPHTTGTNNNNSEDYNTAGHSMKTGL